MKDLSYLQVFPHKVLKGTQMIMRKGFTPEDISTFLGDPEVHKGTKDKIALAGKLARPCSERGKKIDKELAEARAKQKERRKHNGYSDTVKP